MKVYLSEYIHPAAVEHLKAHAEIVDNFDHPEELDGMVVRGVKVTREMIERATNLKVVGRHGVGFEGVDIDAAKAHGVHVVNAPLANATSVAELIVARFLEMSRDLYRANAGMRQGAFTRIAPPEMQGTEVTGKTLGLIGMGNIPQMVAHMMTAAFGVKVVGYDPFVPAEEAIRRGIEKVDTLEALLEQSDLVTISVHLNPQTENMIHGDLFDHFKPSAIFVNTSRGKVVNENDLYEALKAGKLRGAAFDVFATDPAPLPKDSPLLTLDNFSATPHIGGNTQEALYRTGMAVVQNVLDVLDGKPVSSMII